MSKPCLYLDEDVDPTTAPWLRRQGVTAYATLEVSNRSASDPDQLLYAVRCGLALVTFNHDDFWNLHLHYVQNTLGHYGIIAAYGRQPTPDETRHRLLKFITTLTAQQVEGKFFRLTDSCWDP